MHSSCCRRKHNSEAECRAERLRRWWRRMTDSRSAFSADSANSASLKPSAVLTGAGAAGAAAAALRDAE